MLLICICVLLCCNTFQSCVRSSKPPSFTKSRFSFKRSPWLSLHQLPVKVLIPLLAVTTPFLLNSNLKLVKLFVLSVPLSIKVVTRQVPLVNDGSIEPVIIVGVGAVLLSFLQLAKTNKKRNVNAVNVRVLMAIYFYIT